MTCAFVNHFLKNFSYEWYLNHCAPFFFFRTISTTIFREISVRLGISLFQIYIKELSSPIRTIWALATVSNVQYAYDAPHYCKVCQSSCYCSAHALRML